jgi:hypothetical protein
MSRPPPQDRRVQRVFCHADFSRGPAAHLYSCYFSACKAGLSNAALRTLMSDCKTIGEEVAKPHRDG